MSTLEELETCLQQHEGELSQLGILTPSALAAEASKEEDKPYLINGLIGRNSVNLLVGDSNLGKTPLAMHFAIAVASGVSLFGRAVEQGPVLYCDAESSVTVFHEQLTRISRFLDLPAIPPELYVWSPTWGLGNANAEIHASNIEKLRTRIRKLRPKLVVIDALRSFFPDAEETNTNAANLLIELKKSKDASWLVIHHRRKQSVNVPLPRLDEEPYKWLQETAGAHALINQTDTRLGAVESSGVADLSIGGLMRSCPKLPLMEFERVHDESGEPLGYKLLQGIELLGTIDRSIYDRLRDEFTYSEAMALHSGSSGTVRFLRRCEAVGVIKKLAKSYAKVLAPKTAGVVGVEGVANVETPTPPVTPAVEGV